MGGGGGGGGEGGDTDANTQNTYIKINKLRIDYNANNKSEQV